MSTTDTEYRPRTGIPTSEPRRLLLELLAAIHGDEKHAETNGLVKSTEAAIAKVRRLKSGGQR